MSGHSKWSKVKHQKGKTDQIKGQTFTKLGNAITITVREGRGMRLAIEKARNANMPKANIDRAIERGLGKGEEGQLEKITYEGFAVGNVLVIIETATDNRQRTFSTLKNLFSSFGGSLGNQGSVAYMFKTVGAITVINSGKSQDQYTELALEVGGSDLSFEQDKVVVYTDMTQLFEIKTKLSEKGEIVTDAQIVFLPITKINVDNYQKEKVKKLIETLEELDDVLRVTTNIA